MQVESKRHSACQCKVCGTDQLRDRILVVHAGIHSRASDGGSDDDGGGLVARAQPQVPDGVRGVLKASASWRGQERTKLSCVRVLST